MNEEIKVKREWLERLVELGTFAESERRSQTKFPQWIPHLLGYIQGSAEILKKEN